jgi:hypothetical protein
VSAQMTSVQVTNWFLQMTDPTQLAEAPEPVGSEPFEPWPGAARPRPS